MNSHGKLRLRLFNCGGKLPFLNRARSRLNLLFPCFSTRTGRFHNPGVQPLIQESWLQRGYQREGDRACLGFLVMTKMADYCETKKWNYLPV
jgi:hypothetical protein